MLKISAVYLIRNPKICQDPPSCGQDDQTLLIYDREVRSYLINTVIRQKIAWWCQQFFCLQKFVDNDQKCFVFISHQTFPLIFEFSLKVKMMESNPGYRLKSVLLYVAKSTFVCTIYKLESSPGYRLFYFNKSFRLDNSFWHRPIHRMRKMWVAF